MASRDRGAGGRAAFPRPAGLHRSRAQRGERRGPDALASEYACTRDPAARAALVELCTSLVRGVAAGYANPAADLHDDLVQEGFLGLLRAIDRYNPSRGTPFVVFARHFVRGGISHYVRDHRWVVRRPRWMDSAAAPATLSLEGLADSGWAKTAQATTVPSPQSGGEDRVALLESLRALRPLARAVVLHLYFSDLTQMETAARLGISQKHVSRVLEGALRTLRQTMAPMTETV